MAQRRMFSPKIVGSDAFLEMPTSSRELYFQLGMYADDDGFVSPRKIMRMVGASDDDLKMLLAKRFVLPFENGVVVIKHWKINNQIKQDRYTPTVYVEEKKTLAVKDNSAYTERFQNGSKMEPQVSIVKVSVVKKEAGLEAPTPEPFNLKEYLEVLRKDPKKHVRIIAVMLQRKKVKFTTKAQVGVAIRRYSKDAVQVAEFEDTKIWAAIKKIEEEVAVKPYDWGMLTILKKLTSMSNG